MDALPVTARISTAQFASISTISAGGVRATSRLDPSDRQPAPGSRGSTGSSTSPSPGVCGDRRGSGAGGSIGGQGKPPAYLGASHWSTRLMAERLGISFASVARIWRRWNIQPATGGDVQVLLRSRTGSQAARRRGALPWTLVRHEALMFRVEVRDLRRRTYRSRDGESGAADPGRCRDWCEQPSG